MEHNVGRFGPQEIGRRRLSGRLGRVTLKRGRGSRPRPHRRCRSRAAFSAGGDGGRRSPEHPHRRARRFAAADCRTIAMYELHALTGFRRKIGKISGHDVVFKPPECSSWPRTQQEREHPWCPLALSSQHLLDRGTQVLGEIVDLVQHAIEQHAQSNLKNKPRSNSPLAA
jgi:hypothetical protein